MGVKRRWEVERGNAIAAETPACVSVCVCVCLNPSLDLIVGMSGVAVLTLQQRIPIISSCFYVFTCGRDVLFLEGGRGGNTHETTFLWSLELTLVTQVSV